MRKVAIIGGGACGLWCANTLKRLQPSCEVVIFERLATVGKKITMSGNSKGNVTNLGVAPSAYNDSSFVAHVLEYGPLMLIARLHDMGIMTASDDHGRVYPLSESATSFVELFHRDNQERGVVTMLESSVADIKTTPDNRYVVNGKVFDEVVIATGTKAGLSPKLPDNSFPTIDGEKRLAMTSRFPALCALGVSENIAMLNGLRVKADMALALDGEIVFQTTGELQFIEKALSGIAVFELSSFYARERVRGMLPDAAIIVDVCPQLPSDELLAYLGKHVNPKQIGPHSFGGLVSLKLSQYLHNLWRRHPRERQTPLDLAHFLKHLIFNVTHDYVPQNNQIFAGGIRTDEVDPSTLMSKKYPNIYIGGEALDVDGLCGGFNLHFAFAAGETIARAIAAKE